MSHGGDGGSSGDPGELARRRRAVIKALHPDRGGDPAAFVAAMEALDAEARGRAGSTGNAGAPHTTPRTPNRDPGGTVRMATSTSGQARFAAPVRGAAVHLTLRGRLRQVGRRAARKLRRDSRYIDVTPNMERR